MLGPHHIIMRVQYDRQPNYGRIPRMDRTGTEGRPADHDRRPISDPQPARRWEGTVDGPTFERFARAWRLPVDGPGPALPTASGTRALATRRYTLDGMNWEQSGQSPIVCVSLR